MKPQILRQGLLEKPILKVMGAHDAMGAKLVEMHGFDAVWSSGFEIATAHGVPDANILTMTENLDAAVNIHTATRLPVICDCDTGFGNAVNVMHMVKKYEAAGMAALVIEDKLFPKVNSFIPGRQELASIEEFCGKLDAARAARTFPNGTMIFARIEALIAGWGMEEALRRAMAYYEAGAEGLVIHSKSKTSQEIFEFARLWRKKMGDVCPLVAIPTTYYGVTAEELAEAGFKIAIYANQGMRAAVRAMHEVLGEIQEKGTTASVENRIATMQELFALQGMQDYQENEKKFTGETNTSVLIPAAADHKFQPELASLLGDQPLCMVRLAGKTLLDRQLETLRAAGLRDFSLVIGYQKEAIQVAEVRKIENAEYAARGSAHSVMCGLSKMSGRTLVVYSDILFDQKIAETLVESPYPVTLVIDRAYRSLPRRDKKLDLVVTDSRVEPHTRKMGVEDFKKIGKIGKQLDASAADHEFIGMMLFSKEGLEQLKKCWANAEKEYQERPFYEAASIQQASMTDLLQYFMDQGQEIRGLVIEHGWSELYSLEDYRRLERYFSEKSAELLPLHS